MSIASWTSPPASARTFPISCVIRSVSASFSLLEQRARSGRGSRRASAPGRAASSANASFAAATARSTSSAPERGKTPIVSPSAGLVLSKVSPDAASTHSPPIVVSKRRLRDGHCEGSRGRQEGASVSGKVPGIRGRRRSAYSACRRTRLRRAGRGLRGGRRSPSRSGCPCSTRPSCRRARASSSRRDDAVDHPARL